MILHSPEIKLSHHIGGSQSTPITALGDISSCSNIMFDPLVKFPGATVT